MDNEGDVDPARVDPDYEDPDSAYPARADLHPAAAPAELEMRHLSAEEIIEIVIAIGEEEVILVGGQALNVWAEWTLPRAPEELQEFAPYTSKDIDYRGNAAAAAEFADRMGGICWCPDMDTHTVNAATVTFERNGRVIVVDFLKTLAGVPDQKLKNGVVEVPLSVHGEDAPPILMNVLHPILVLQSRIGNVARLGRRDPGSLRQLRAALVIAREYVLSQLEAEEDGIKDAQKTVTDIHDIIASTEADQVFEEFNVDPVAILRAVANHPAWHPKFNEHQVVGRAESLTRARAHRLQERRRRLDHLGAAPAPRGGDA